MIMKNNELLDFISSIEHDETINGIRLMSFKKNQPIITANKFMKHIYIIKNGFCKCSINEDNNKTYILEFLGNGEIIGEIEGILGCKTITSVLAMTEMSIYKIEINTFNNLMLNNKKFNQLILKELATRLSNTATRASFQQLNTVEISLSKILSIQKKENLTFSKKDLSEYLGISLRSLNRELLKINSK